MAKRKRLSREARRRKKRRFLLDIQQYRCFYCAQVLTFEKSTVDHLLPQSLGGTDSIDNLVAACMPCNSRRGIMSVREMLKITEPLALLPCSKPNPWRKTRAAIWWIIDEITSWCRRVIPCMSDARDASETDK